MKRRKKVKEKKRNENFLRYLNLVQKKKFGRKKLEQRRKFFLFPLNIKHFSSKILKKWFLYGRKKKIAKKQVEIAV